MSEPVSIQIDRLFVVLDEALAYAIKQSGNKAKSVAWDVRGHFLRELGHYRTGASLASTNSTRLEDGEGR